jgi:hypothetical protein
MKKARQALAARGIDMAAELQHAIENRIEHYLLPLTRQHQPSKQNLEAA